MGWGCWEGFTEPVVLELSPKGGYNLARNAKRENTFSAEGLACAKARKKRSLRDGFLKEFL